MLMSFNILKLIRLLFTYRLLFLIKYKNSYPNVLNFQCITNVIDEVSIYPSFPLD